MDNDEHTQTAQDRREAYEAPSLRVLGSFAALTEGIPGNSPSDGLGGGVS